ncbi:hypothetical protein VR45_26760 [Streptomyces sp. NRRL S-495]|nr:hypothetical protein VR45_26760 [Streptomyces sp. NRRL S-495]
MLVSKGCEPGSRRDRLRVLDDVRFESPTRRDEVLVRRSGCSRRARPPSGRRVCRWATRRSTGFFDFEITELEGLPDRWKARRGEA